MADFGGGLIVDPRISMYALAGLPEPPRTRGPAGAPGTTPGTSATQSQQESHPTWMMPDLVQALAGSLGQAAGTAGGSYMDYLQNPTASPLFQNTAAGILSAAQPQLARGTQNLMDVFRAQGMLGSSTFGRSMADYQAAQNTGLIQALSQLLGQQFPQMSQALFAPMGQIGSLINALKGQTSTSTSTSQATQFPPTGGSSLSVGPSGGGGGMGGGGGGGGLSSAGVQPGIGVGPGGGPSYLSSEYNWGQTPGWSGGGAFPEAPFAWDYQAPVPDISGWDLSMFGGE